MRLKKWLNGTTLLAISSLLVACGTGPGEAEDEANEETAGGDSSALTIDWWTPSWSDEENEWIENSVEEFNESQSEIFVNLDVIPGDAWDQRVTAAQAAGTAPDITTMNYNKIAFSAEQNEIMALDEYVDPSIFEDLHDNIEGFVSIGDEHYAYPFFVEPSAVLFYRKDFFEEAGLDAEMPPTTWEELIEAGKALGDGNRAGLAAAGNATEIAWTHWGWQKMVGGSLINDEWSEATINSPEITELVNFWGQLHEEGILPPQGFEGGYNEITPLADGQAAMQISGSWVIGQLRNQYPDILDDIGVAVVPTPDGNQEVATATLGGWTLTVDGMSDNPQEAADFITWLLADDEERLVSFFRDVTRFSKFPARESVDQVINEDPEGSKDPWRQLIADEIVPYAVPEPIFAWEISMAYATAVENVYLGGMNVESALEEAENEINTYIENNNYAGTNPRQQ